MTQIWPSSKFLYIKSVLKNDERKSIISDSCPEYHQKVLGNYEKKHGKEKEEKDNKTNNPSKLKYKKVIKNADLSLKTRMKASLLEKIIHQVRVYGIQTLK